MSYVYRYPPESGVPLPPRSSWHQVPPGERKPAHELLYPWSLLNPGDSFFVETSDPERTGNSVYASGRMFAIRRGLSWRFAVRRVTGGIRVWRVE